MSDHGPTPFVECRAGDCHYLVTAHDETCPDCGRRRPAAPPKLSLLKLFPDITEARFATAVLVAMFAPPLILFLIMALTGLEITSDISAALTLLCVGVTYGTLRLVEVLRKRPRRAEPLGSGLRLAERTILQRLVEIKQQQQQVEAVLERAGREEPRRAAELRAPLAASGEADEFARRLDEALREREAARPALDGADIFNLQVSLTDFSASFDELEDEYRRVRAETDEGERMRQLLVG